MINNRYTILLCILLNAAFIKTEDHIVILQSDILAMVDGQSIGINGTTISLIKKYQGNIMNILRGKRNPDGSREGYYEWHGKKYNIMDLAELEDYGQLSADDQKNIIAKARYDFEKMSLEFKPVAQGSKPIMAVLIAESCKLRNRNDSLMVIWSKTKEENEEALFDKHVKTIRDFEIFLIDLYNYLNDLCHSCPKAMKQFKDNTERFAKIKSFMTRLPISKDRELAFMKFATKMVEHMNPGDITEHKIQEIYTAYKNQY